MEYDVDLAEIAIYWSEPDAGWRRRLARVTFTFRSDNEALPDSEVSIVLDAHTQPDGELVDRAWSKLHDRLGEMQTAAAKAADQSRKGGRRNLRKA